MAKSVLVLYPLHSCCYIFSVLQAVEQMPMYSVIGLFKVLNLFYTTIRAPKHDYTGNISKWKKFESWELSIISNRKEIEEIKNAPKTRNSHGSNSQNRKTKGNAVALGEGFSLLG